MSTGEQVLGLAGPRQELILTPGENLAKPIQVVSAEVATMAANMLPETLAYAEIMDAEGFKKASDQLNQVAKLGKFISEQGTALGAPFRAESARIKGEADKLAKPLLEQAVAHLNALMRAWRVKEEAERQRALAEARRLEAEKFKLAQERERLQLEAKQRQDAAALELDKSNTDAEFKEAAAKFDDGLAAQELADEQAKLVKDAAAKAAEAAREVVAPVKAKGTREKMKATILEYDLANVPMPYHQLDEAKLRKAIEGGMVTVEDKWVQFRLDPVFSGSGR